MIKHFGEKSYSSVYYKRIINFSFDFTGSNCTKQYKKSARLIQYNIQILNYFVKNLSVFDQCFRRIKVFDLADFTVFVLTDKNFKNLRFSKIFK